MFRPVASILPIVLGLWACTSHDDGDIVTDNRVGVADDRVAVAYKVGAPYRVDGVAYVPRIDPDYDETGVASWYGPGFHGRPTANGDIYDMNALTAAHPTLPMPSRVRVVNLENGRTVVLEVNDRGPFVKGRIIDVSQRAARDLGFLRQGTARVRVRVLDSPAFAAAGPAHGIYVQAGSFASFSNARQLQARLSRIASFEVSTIRTHAGVRHRVRAGPLRSRAEASKLVAGLDAAGYAGAGTTDGPPSDSGGAP